jgi:hypothetical protein
MHRSIIPSGTQHAPVCSLPSSILHPPLPLSRCGCAALPPLSLPPLPIASYPTCVFVSFVVDSLYHHAPYHLSPRIQHPACLRELCPECLHASADAQGTSYASVFGMFGCLVVEYSSTIFRCHMVGVLARARDVHVLHCDCCGCIQFYSLHRWLRKHWRACLQP